MKARYKNDGDRGRGFACFECAEVLEPSAQYLFSLCKASDNTFLGKSSWQSAEEKHSPDEWRQDGGKALLYVGPSIVDRLAENENYQLVLYTENLLPQKANFSIAEVNRSPRTDQGFVQGVGPATPQTQQIEPPAPSESDASAPERLTESDIAASPSAPPNKLPIIFVLILLIGGGVWWFTRQKSENPPVAEQNAEPDQAARPFEQEKNPEETKTPESATPPALPPREQVRQYLRGAPTAQGAMDLYRILTASPDSAAGDTRDSVYRLLYFAAQQGDAAAVFGLAQCVDPAKPVWGSIPKNGREAWAGYARVAAKEPDAAKAMHTLKKWLEDEAARGNAHALQWVDEIAKDSVTR